MRRPFLLLSLALCFDCCSHGSAFSNPGRGGPVETQNSAVEPGALTPAGEEELRGILASGRLSGLQWPNFSQQSAAVKEFYDEAGYRLAWTRGGKPTPQAT